MRMKFLLLFLLYAVCTRTEAFDTQSELKQFAGNTDLIFAVESNFAGDMKFSGQLTIRNHSGLQLPAGAGDWQIYLHSIRKLDELEASGLKISHIQGDLHSIAPTARFAGLASGKSLQINFSGANWIVSYSDFMPRAFIATKGLKPEIFANTNTENTAAFVLPFTRREQQLRQKDDRYTIATAQSRFNENLAVNASPFNRKDLESRIFPTPKNVEYFTGHAVIDGSWRIYTAGSMQNEADYLQHALRQQAGLNLSRSDAIDAQAKRIELRIDSTLKSHESYRLDISPGKISIAGGDAAGVFYGIQSLLSLIPANQTGGMLQVPSLHAFDAPRYAWRGMHYDMARNFHGKQVTLRLIEQMARFKLNKLHLHLTDDEGWRLQIRGLPELTDIGAKRCFDLQEQDCLLTQLGTGPNSDGTGNGYYSQHDFIEILKYAASRHIEVIPEIDMPGHSRAAIKAMQARYNRLKKSGDMKAAQQYLLTDPLDSSKYLSVQNYNDNSMNVCQESSYQFIAKVVDDIKAMYQQAGLHLNILHIGGDEVAKGSWQGSPNCQALFADADSGVKSAADLKFYFVKKLSALLQQYDIALAGWEDGLMIDATTPLERSQLPNKRIIADVWDNIWEWGVADRAYRLANADYQVVLAHATHLYFDHPQEANAEERGYYWATRYSNTQKVFNYLPDNLYANADKTRMGEDIINLEKTVGRPLPQLEKPENIIGMQGNVWSETIRNSEQLEQMVYPRLLMMAERAWHKAEWEGVMPDIQARDGQWAEMAQLLAMRELPKLQKQGISVYLPTPGVQIIDGRASANSALPGLKLEYSINLGKTWQAYESPVLMQSTSICFRSHAAGDKSYSRQQCVAKTQ